MTAHPYNPLAKANLADSIARALLRSPVHPLSDTSSLVGAGIYLIYYTGSLDWYRSIADANRKSAFEQPIYVGKAIPKGGRKGGITDSAAAKGRALRDRLSQHFTSVSEAINLEAGEFYFRSLVVDDIWIPLGENILIELHKPVWNRVVDGFGNKDPGKRRKSQFRSSWDVIHPGRKFAEKLGQNPKSAAQIVADIRLFFEKGVSPSTTDNPDEEDDPAN